METKKVICIKNSRYTNFIVGKMYNAEESYVDGIGLFKDYYVIDYDYKHHYNKELFISLQEYRKLKLKRLNEL